MRERVNEGTANRAKECQYRLFLLFDIDDHTEGLGLISRVRLREKNVALNKTATRQRSTVRPTLIILFHSSQKWQLSPLLLLLHFSVITLVSLWTLITVSQLIHFFSVFRPCFPQSCASVQLCSSISMEANHLVPWVLTLINTRECTQPLHLLILHSNTHLLINEHFLSCWQLPLCL